MKSTKNSRAVIVGIFILLGIAIFVITVLTLGGQQKTFSKAFTIRAVFDDINGLQKGNNIWFSGVKIGTVKKIAFVGQGSSEVEVDMNIDASAREYIRKNAKARISSDGLIGNKIIVIYSGASKFPAVEDGDLLGVEKGVNPEEMMITLQANNRNLLDITNDFKFVSKNIAEGKGAVGRLLTDDRLVSELQTTMTMLKRAAANAERLSSTVANYTSQLNRKGTLANDLITDTTIFSSLRTTTAQMEDVSRTANTVVSNLSATSNELRSNLNNKNAPIGMLLKDEEVAADIRVTLSNLQASSIRLNEDLEAAQHNFLLRGYFKKKDKKEAEEAKELEKQRLADSTNSTKG